MVIIGEGFRGSFAASKASFVARRTPMQNPAVSANMQRGLPFLSSFKIHFPLHQVSLPLKIVPYIHSFHQKSASRARTHCS